MKCLFDLIPLDLQLFLIWNQKPLTSTVKLPVLRDILLK